MSIASRDRDRDLVDAAALDPVPTSADGALRPHIPLACDPPPRRTRRRLGRTGEVSAALTGLAGVDVGDLTAAARGAATALESPGAQEMLDVGDVGLARRTFLHWDA